MPFYQLLLVHQLWPLLDKDSLAMVEQALVTSRLDYCNALYVRLPLRLLQKLELVQNAAAQLLSGAAPFPACNPSAEGTALAAYLLPGQV